MCIIMRSTERTARKDYDCDASPWITEGGILQENGVFSFSDLRILVKARCEGDCGDSWWGSAESVSTVF